MNQEQERIKGVIFDYLTKQTNYAIMLTAPWGAGKTYFLRNAIFNDLDSYGYKGIMVSLFGVNSVQDIKHRIALELYPFLNNNMVKAAGNMARMLVKMTDLSFFGKLLNDSPVDQDDRVVASLMNNFAESIDLTKLVICLDDLERVKSNLLTTNEILGYINGLVESENIKVIIVANKDKFENHNFDLVKEKVIGNTLHFSQDFNLAFDNLVAQLPVAASGTVSIMKEHRQLIHECLLRENGTEVNYRTLKYFLSYFEPIAHEILTWQEPDFLKLRKKIFENVLTFSLLVCIEYRKGVIDFKKREGLDSELINSHLIWSEDTYENKTYAGKIVEDYFGKNYFYFIEPIYDYLTGGQTFDVEKFAKQIRANYHIQDDKTIPEHYQFYNSISHHNAYDFEDDQYVEMLKSIKLALDQGKFSPWDYLNVFYYLTRFSNPLNLNEEQLADEMVSLLDNIVNHKYHPVAERYLSLDESSSRYSHYKKIKAAIIDLNERSKSQMEQEIDQRYFELFEHDFDKFYDEILATKDEEAARNPSVISSEHYIQRFINSRNAVKFKMISLLNFAYHETRAWSFGKTDQDFLNDLQTEMEKVDSTAANFGPLSADLWQMLERSVANLSRET